MNSQASIQQSSWQGVREIFAFNWHWYALGVLLIAGTAAALVLVPFGEAVRTVAWLGLGAVVLWSAASLLVSHWIYDRSPLRAWTWVRPALAAAPKTWCHLHCGLDESSATLRSLFPNATATVLDIYDPAEMTEPSIARARQMSGTNTTAANFRRLPLAAGSMSAVFVLFAAHELRNPDSRTALFAEARRILGRHGEVIVAEHMRDAANFCAFGPGAFHFFGRRDWLKTFRRAGLAMHREFTITPFVRIFVLRRAT